MKVSNLIEYNLGTALSSAAQDGPKQLLLTTNKIIEASSKIDFELWKYTITHIVAPKAIGVRRKRNGHIISGNF